MTSAPNAKNIDPEQIPAELRERRQWVAWLLRVRADKLTKEPWRPTPRRTFLASSTDPSTWGTFEGAITALSWADGIGFVFAPDDPYTGVDFDECRDRLTGALDPLIASYIARLASYTEASPSGAGVHVIVRAEIPDDLDGRRRGDVKMYCRGRYFTISGDHIAGSPTTVEDRQAELEAVYHDVFPAPEPTTFTTAAPRNITGDDRELIDQAMRAANGWKFELLWNGRWDGQYKSRSEADAALCSMLAFWMGDDAARVDALFRRSGLYRDKWDREDYRAKTLAFALSGAVGPKPRAPRGSTSSQHRHPPRSRAGQPPPTDDAHGGADDKTSDEHDEPRQEPTLKFTLLRDFAAVAEESAEPLLGTKDNTAIPAGGSILTYGSGGAGKTTWTLDGVAHLASGTTWLGLEVPCAVRVVVVENEGPRGKFRTKLDQKMNSWTGRGFAEQVWILEEPWTRFTFSDETHRRDIAAFLNENQIDLLSFGPVATVGMVGGGTPDEINAFVALLNETRSLVDHPLAWWGIHHENRAGQVSGAWERVPATLVHLTSRGNGHTRVYWQKARWASELHDTTMHLASGDGQTFTVEEPDEPATPECIWDEIAAYVLANGGVAGTASRRTSAATVT
jgi:hypothetical protein